MAHELKRIIGETFLELSQTLATGRLGRRPIMALSGMSSEHGEREVVKGALAADGPDLEVIYIGSVQCERLRSIIVSSEEEAISTLNVLLDSGEADGAVTMHYPFPIGVATVGRVLSPARGTPFYLATTTGTSSTDRVKAMIRNAIYGIISAQACGNPRPTVGVANLDGARQVETGLKELAQNGYPILWALSQRPEGGCILRGNDILNGAADVIVTDTLTGNIITKMLSAFTSGGSYESLGWGYGPGIGEAYDRLVLIVSRASGAPVISGALAYGAQMVRGGWQEVAARQFQLAKKAGFDLLAGVKSDPSFTSAEIKLPPKEVVTAEIPGIDVMDIDQAVSSLWSRNIYAEGGMGCTGPVVLVADSKYTAAKAWLQKNGFLD